MRNHSARPAKMLISLVGRRRGEKVVEVAKAAGARGGTIALGKALGSSRLLQALSLADIQVDVVFILMGAEAGAVTGAIRQAADGDPKKWQGIAIVLAVPQLFLRIPSNQDNPAATAAETTETEPMDSGYKLISVIVNSGFGDDVMAEARKAGAFGGTILGARGTGTEDDVKFFGITLVPEKEMLLIVAEKEKVPAITDAIGTIPTLCEPGGGIMYTMNVEEFIQMGK